MAIATCPKPETLAAFARGELVAEELSAVAEHVGGCEACCRALQLVPEDSLANLARAAAAEPHTIQSGGPPQSLLPIDPNEKTPAGFVDHPRYRIISKLGSGGMGTVYKAEDLLMGRIIAIKVVSTHLTAKPGAVSRFQKEIRAVAQLKDHHIVMVHDAGEAGGSHFLVMELVEGVSLDRLVAKKGPLSVPLACMFTRQVALGLQHAADKGMVHRDIKPQNLIVTRKGQVKILDFGLARIADADEEPVQGGRPPFGAGKPQTNIDLTNPNLVMGTPDYLSPEQAHNSHDVDPRSDIYSLGCTLYFLLTGQPPFIAATTLLDKLLSHTQDEPPAIRQARLEVPEELAEVLAKMMAKKPADRYQKASEAAAALLLFTRSDNAKEPEPAFEIVEAVAVTPSPRASGVVTRPITRPTPITDEASDTTPPGMPTLTDTPRPKRTKKKKKRASWWQRRKWGVIGGVTALILLVAGAIAVSGGKKHGDKSPPPEPSESVKRPTTGSQPGNKKDDKPNRSQEWTPPTVITPPQDDVVVLFVIPSNGVFVPDYREVREQLEVQRLGTKRVRVDTAATSGDRSQPIAGGPGPRDPAPIPIDVNISEGMNLSKYSAVIFCGYNVDEYTDTNGRGKRAANYVIQKMLQTGKPVASICAGQAVLAADGVLKGRKAAFPPHIEYDSRFRWMFADNSIQWLRGSASTVIVDRTSGKVVITAAGPPQAKEFTEAIIKAIERK